MHTLPDSYRKLYAQILYVLVCPLFFMVFAILYSPFGLDGFLDMGRSLFAFNVSIIASIILGVLALSRLTLYLLRARMKHFTWAHYVVWCIGEVFLAAQFISLYVTLMLHGSLSFFSVVAKCVGISYAILIYPYLVLTLSIALDAKKKAAAAAAAADDDSLIRFFDEYKKLRLIIAQQAVLFIQAEENYVSIHYLDAGRAKRFVLRASMRSLEETAGRHGLVRCQRSYYINPQHVKVLRRETGSQIMAELDVDGFPGIPVSRSYYDKLSSLL
ncbi:MAG: LytTR family transcriptional regulator DNA-binding domain-containing protein [Bacteroidales bacterium]|nr:LytTR family transcriptional regulator DNA-binding domain-containing protein [Bacteroidales bacterium]